MQKKVLSLVLAAMPWMAIAQLKSNDWGKSHRSIFQHRYCHTPGSFLTPMNLLPFSKQSSANILSLDGMWKFHIVNKPSERPVRFL